MAKKTPQPKRTKKETSKKIAAAVQEAAEEAKAAKLAPPPPAYRSFRLQKRAKKQDQPALPGVFKLTGTMLQLFRKHWKLIGGIVLIYGFLNLLLVRGFSIGGGYDTIKQNLQHGGVGSLLSSSTLFMYLLGSSGSSSGSNVSAGSYQFALMLVVSLALIWALRQVTAGNKISVRDSFYKGMTPLVPFMLLALAIFLQLIPMVIGITLYGVAVTNGVASIFLEKALWGLLALAFSLLSLYLITPSIFALYIVTLPDMTPRKALRSARELLAGRRWVVLAKIAFLPVMLLVATAVVIIPLIVILAPLALWVFFALGIISIAVVHGYLYTVYRTLL